MADLQQLRLELDKAESELLEYVASTDQRIDSLEIELAHTQAKLAKLTKQVEYLVDMDLEARRYA